MLRERIKAVWELARGGNALVTAVAVWVGGAVGAESVRLDPALVGGVSAALIAAWGNAINDIYDRKLDARRKTERPLPSGRIGVGSAVALAISFAGVGLVLAGSINSAALQIAILTVVLLWAYSFRLKGWLFVGNIVVSFLAGLAFVYGAVVQGELLSTILPQCWFAFGFALLWHLAREWVKAVQDVEEDQAEGLRTMAVAFGSKAAGRAAAVVLALLLVALWPPWIYGYFDMTYGLLVLFGVVPVLVGAIMMLWNGCDPVRFERLARVLKWDMLIGVLAIWLGLS